MKLWQHLAFAIIALAGLFIVAAVVGSAVGG